MHPDHPSPLILILSSHLSSLDSGQTDTFTVTAKDVGELQTLKIWHDNKVTSPRATEPLDPPAPLGPPEP